MSSLATEPETEHVSRRALSRDIAITAVVAVALHLPSLIRKAALNSDEATMATVARMMRHGARLYTGAVDRKPPGAFLVYRLLEPLFGMWSLTAARWVALCAIVVAAWIIALEARRRWTQVLPLAVALLFVVAFAALPAEDSSAVGFELLAILPMVAAFVLGARGRVLLAGAALGVATLFKQPMLLGALPLTAQCLSISAPWSRRFVRLALSGTVCAATILLGLAPFGLHNALAWFAGNGDNYLGGTRLSTVAIIALEQIGSIVALTGGLLVLAAVAWGKRRLPLDLTVWVISSVIAASIGFRFVLHYFNQLLPALVLMAAPALTSFAVMRRPWPRFATVWIAGASAFSMFTLLTANSFHDLPNVDHVARAVAERTKPGDKVFVWGQAPEIYWLSQRDPATRYPHVGFITGITPKRPGVPAYLLSMPSAAETLLSDLAANHPALIIDAAIKRVRGGDRYPMATSPVAAFVKKGYCVIDVIDQISLLAPCKP
ncbi:MAG: glycosyltransferase family 87 protein [Actinomycetota bacterium]|jgi:hypothetical protein